MSYLTCYLLVVGTSPMGLTEAIASGWLTLAYLTALSSFVLLDFAEVVVAVWPKSGKAYCLIFVCCL